MGVEEEYSGTWQFEVDFEEGTVEGWFEGDGSGDISGTFSDGTISTEAEGDAAMGAIKWSDDFSADGEEVSGTWEGAEDVPGSGTWSGSLGAVEEEEEQEEEDSGPSVSSIDAEWIGYEGGEFDGGVRIRARNMDTENYDWRVESADENEDYVVIYNNDEDALYITQAGDETWTKATGSLAEDFGKDSMEDMATSSEKWAEDLGEGTHDVNYGASSMEIEIDVNPSLEDDLFVPPEGAEVEEPIMG
ncbi:MAG: hypothetical protein ACLFQ8_02875 [Candidatus Aenigmatarchaeota archaeon]